MNVKSGGVDNADELHTYKQMMSDIENNDIQIISKQNE
jgi:hypothetical protein